MQTTLLSLALAAILALLAALFGPALVDWTRYRTAIETRASAALGVAVRIGGAVDLRLLPIPWLAVDDVQIGSELRARSLRVEFAFSPMLRGEWRATQLQLRQPALALRLGARGVVEGPALPGLDPDHFAIERLVVEDGVVTVTDTASGRRASASQIAFAGDVKSLAGPARAEGSLVHDGARVGFRLAVGRAGEEGARVRLGFERAAPDKGARPASGPQGSQPQTQVLEVDGQLRLAEGVPRFEGQLTASRASPGPVKVTGRVRASPSAALFEQIEATLGSEERGARLTGTAELKLGAAPRLEGVFSARQIDLDGLLGLPETRVPFDAVRALASLLKDTPPLPLPARFGLSIDNVLLAGASVSAVRGDVAAENGGFDIERFEMRAPGASHIRFSGRLSPTGATMAFAGPATLQTLEARTLIAWLEGRSAQQVAAVGALRASGTLALGAERLAAEDLRIDIDRKTLEGRVAFLRDKARLEAELRAPDIDIDALRVSMEKILAGTAFSLPQEAKLDVDVGRATMFGVVASGVAAHMRLDGAGLIVERLAVADLGGASFLARGTIEDPLKAAHGALTVDLDAKDLRGVISVLADVAPGVAERLKASAPRLTPVKMRLSVALTRAQEGREPTAQVDLEGRAGVLRVGALVDAKGGLSPTEWTLDGRVDADDGRVLGAILSLDGLAAIDQRRAWARVVAGGAKTEASRITARVQAGGFDASAKGSGRWASEGLAGAFDVQVSADAQRLRPRGAGGPLPLQGAAHVALQGGGIAITALSGTLGGAAFGGALDLAFWPSPRVTGRLTADTADGLALAAVLGAPVARGAWSAEPFEPRLPALAADIDIAVREARLLGVGIGELSAVLRLSPRQVVLDTVAGTLAGGALRGRIALSEAEDGVTAQIQLSLKDVAAVLGWPDQDPRLRGRTTLAAELAGTGRSPAAVLGALKGSGTIAVHQGEILGLDARVFETLTRAADRGLPIDSGRVSEAVGGAVKGGRMAVAAAEATVAVAAGQARLGPVTLRGEGIESSLAAQFDLAAAQGEARWTVAAPRPGESAPEFGVLVKGTAQASMAEFDVTRLIAWLTLRAVERQSKRIEAIENAEKEGEAAPPVTSTVPKQEGLAPPLPPAIIIPDDGARRLRSPAGSPRGDVRPARGGAGDNRRRNDVGPVQISER